MKIKRNKSSAITEMVSIFLVNSHPGTVKNAIVDANDLDFYGTTTLWCLSLNSLVGRYGIQL